MVDCRFAEPGSLKHHHGLRTLSRNLPLTMNMWINGCGFLARGPVFIFSAVRLRVLMYVDFISDE